MNGDGMLKMCCHLTVSGYNAPSIGLKRYFRTSHHNHGLNSYT